MAFTGENILNASEINREKEMLLWKEKERRERQKEERKRKEGRKIPFHDKKLLGNKKGMTVVKQQYDDSHR